MVITDAIWVLVLVLIPSVIGIANDTNQTQTETLGVAIEEMQKANYFAFVMLLNMLPPNQIPANITFLMPNNRVLSKAIIPENNVRNFLLRHSIPSPLRFDHLTHFPTGTIIPSSEPDFMLRVVNRGRRSFFLDNVKLVSPDLCVADSSVRCHGIDGLLLGNTALPPVLAPPPLPDDVPASSFGSSPAATPAPQPAESVPSPKKSGSSCLGLAASVGLTVFILWPFMAFL